MNGDLIWIQNPKEKKKAVIMKEMKVKGVTSFPRLLLDSFSALLQRLHFIEQIPIRKSKSSYEESSPKHPFFKVQVHRIFFSPPLYLPC